MKLNFKNNPEFFYIFLLFLSGLIIYLPSLFISFFGDEPAFISRNAVNTFTDWFELLDKKVYDGAYYRPIGNLLSGTLTLLFGSHEWLYRLFNLLLHTINGIMVFKFTGLIVKSERNKLLVPFFAGLFFILFPLHDLAVIWHTDLFDRLLLLFYLSSIIFYLRGKLITSLTFALLSFLTKEMAFSLPLIIFISGYLIAGKKPSTTIKDAAFFFGLLLSVIIFRYVVLDNYLFQSDLTHPDSGFATIIKNVVFFGGLLVFPFDSYNIKEHFLNHPLLFALIGAVIFALLVFLVFRDRSKSKIYFYLLLFVLLTLAPASRLLMKWYLYLPSAGFVIFLSVLFSSIKHYRVRFAIISALIIVYSAFLLHTEYIWIKNTTQNDRIIDHFSKTFGDSVGTNKIYFLTIPAKISGYPVNHLNPAELLRYKLNIDNEIEILSRSAIENWYDKIDCFGKENDIRLEHKFPNYFVIYGYENLLQYSVDDITEGKLTGINITSLPDEALIFSYSENKYFKVK